MVNTEIANLYSSGKSVLEISKQIQLSTYLVLQSLKKQGIPRRSRTETNLLRATAKVDQTELARLHGEAILSIQEIADHFGVSVPTIVRLNRRLGLKSKKGHGSPGEKNGFWKGGRCQDDDGYILIWHPKHPFARKSGYVLEHRLVMEAHIGRYLTEEEVVHHEDTVTDNNMIGNLELFASNADHLRYELTGKIPNFSEDGLRRIRENTQRVNLRRSIASRQAKENDGQQ